MSDYRLLVADIDGTVVDHGSNGSEVSDKHPAKLAIGNALKHGKSVTFATGRNYQWAKPVIDAFELVTPVIVNSGARITDPTNDQVLWEKRLNSEQGKLIYKFIIEQGMADDLMIGLGYLEETPFTEATTKSIDSLIYLDLIGFTKPEDIRNVLEFVEKLGGVSAAVPPSPQMPGRKNIIVTNSEGTKYNALLELQRILNIKKAETIAIGDAGNDLPLFEASGLKVAVDNASDQLKEAADLVVSSVHEHGIVEIINDKLI
jgi:hypothetical protein